MQSIAEVLLFYLTNEFKLDFFCVYSYHCYRQHKEIFDNSNNIFEFEMSSS